MTETGWMGGGFFLGVDSFRMPSDFPKVCISANLLRGRQARFHHNLWMMDSGAFTEVSNYGGHRTTPSEYARLIRYWAGPSLLTAVSQDYMCEKQVLKVTGLNVAAHQTLTLSRYEELLAQDVRGVYVLPVLQGFTPAEYVRHLRMYGGLLAPGAWVGVGSVCRRNASPKAVVEVLEAVKAERPDLRLHGFGLKVTALQSPEVVKNLWSSDSMAWGFASQLKDGTRDRTRFIGGGVNRFELAVQYHERVLAAIEAVRKLREGGEP